MPIDSTVGGAASNSYVSLAEADAYFLTVFGREAWATLDPALQEQLLISATQSLDAYIQWNGVRATEEQSLDWPRYGAYDKDGRLYADDIIPKDVKYATFELAFYINANNGLSFEPNKLSEVKVGSVDVKFTDYIAETGLPKFIESLLSYVGTPTYTDGASMKMVKLQRV